MFEYDYYTIKDLLEKLNISSKDIIHQGIQGKLPIYISPLDLAEKNYGGPQGSVRAFFPLIFLLHREQGMFVPSTRFGSSPDNYERLSKECLTKLDKQNIYQAKKSLEVSELWSKEGQRRTISVFYPLDNSRSNLSVHLSDLYILSHDFKKLEQEYSAFVESRIAHNDSTSNHPKEKLSSPLTTFSKMKNLKFKEITIKIDPVHRKLRVSAREKKDISVSFNHLKLFKKHTIILNAEGETFLALANGSFDPDNKGAKRSITRLSKTLRDIFDTKSTPFLAQRPQFKLYIPKDKEARRKAIKRTTSYNDDIDKSADDFLRHNDPYYDH